MPIFWSKLGERPDFLSYVCVCVCCSVPCLFYSSVYLPPKSQAAQSMPQCGRETRRPVSFTKVGNWTWHQENARRYRLQKEILPKDKHNKVSHCQRIKWKPFQGVWIRVLNFCTCWSVFMSDFSVRWKTFKPWASKGLKSKGLMSGKMPWGKKRGWHIYHGIMSIVSP